MKSSETFDVPAPRRPPRSAGSFAAARSSRERRRRRSSPGVLLPRLRRRPRSGATHRGIGRRGCRGRGRRGCRRAKTLPPRLRLRLRFSERRARARKDYGATGKDQAAPPVRAASSRTASVFGGRGATALICAVALVAFVAVVAARGGSLRSPSGAQSGAAPCLCFPPPPSRRSPPPPARRSSAPAGTPLPSGDAQG